MSDEMPIGGNAEAELKRRIDRRVDLLDQVAELKDELAEFKAEDKADGFTEKAIANAVKLLRADAETVLATLLLEAEIDVYRKAAGIATTIETAQERAQRGAESVPEARRSPKRAKKRGETDADYHDRPQVGRKGRLQ